MCHLHGNKVSLTYLFSEEFHAQGPSAEYIAAEKAATRDEEPPSRSVLQFISHRLHLSHLSHHFLMGPEVQATWQWRVMEANSHNNSSHGFNFDFERTNPFECDTFPVWLLKHCQIRPEVLWRGFYLFSRVIRVFAASPTQTPQELRFYFHYNFVKSKKKNKIKKTQMN